ncbi:MAG: hypothetical protein KDC97_11165 [Confluentibacter sp.]|nr:hypothetical protein [Confluentibacter sp.]
MKLFKKEKHTNLSLLERLGNRVYFGPFTGLKIPQSVWSILTTSEILGLYESCLHPKFESLLNKEIKNIMLIGGNNGYYAAGISCFLNPDSFAIYETEAYFHPFIKSWFQENKLQNYAIYGKASEEEFSKIDSKIDLVFMDCEGFEIELLNPLIFPWQEQTEILAEIHPFYIDNLIATLSNRFRKTHRIELIYDDFDEDAKIDKILKGMDLNIPYHKHPSHRWIMENGNKINTSGIFMYLTPY